MVLVCLVTITLRGGQNFGSNLFNNEKVTSSSSSSTEPVIWSYENTKYWPSKGHIDFLAYAPFDNSKTLSGTKINFTVNSDITAQKDLLWANAANKTEADNPVKFTFYHALSRLGYTVKLKGKCSSDATITLKKITLSATKPTTGAATKPTTGAFYTNGTIDLSTGNWTTSKDDTKQDFDWFSAGTQTVTFTSASNVSHKNPATDYLFVIPQNFSQEGNTLYVIVEYDIKYTGVSEIITNKVYKQLTNDFEQGKAYMINLTIGRPIEFDVEVVKEWGNDTPVDINSWEYIK